MRRFAYLVVLFHLALAPACLVAEEPQLPDPPEGFSWQWCEDIRAAFLRPEGWHFREQKSDDTYACFITKEKIEGEEGSFETGLTVNVTSNVSKKTSGKASDFAARFTIAATKDPKTVLMNTPPVDRGRVKTFVFRIERDDTVVHHVILADDPADKVYLVLFESPDDEWDAAWKTGEGIIKRLYFELPQ